MSVETLMADGDRDDYILMGLAEAQNFANYFGADYAPWSDSTEKSELEATKEKEDNITVGQLELIYGAGTLATQHTVSRDVQSGVLPGSDYWLG